MDKDRVQAFENRCRELIEEHGHMVQGVGANGWAYTIGLESQIGCELICVGLPNQVATHLLNDLAARLKAGDIADGVPIEEIANMPVKLITYSVDEHPELSSPLLNVAMRLGYRTKRLRQMLWPDKEGRFPGDAGYNLLSQNLLRLAQDDDDTPVKAH